jgi:hypothetical protein
VVELLNWITIGAAIVGGLVLVLFFIGPRE